MVTGSTWTPERDAKLLALRASGWTWGKLAREFELGAQTVREHWLVLNGQHGRKR